MAKYLISVCLAALVGCASVSEMNITDKFEKTTRAYRQALQWGDWPTAKQYLDPDRAIKDQINLDELKQIKVTSYEVIDLIPAEDKMRAQQTVEIKYYFIKRMVEKTLIDKQIWVYSESTGWRLTSGLPSF